MSTARLIVISIAALLFAAFETWVAYENADWANKAWAGFAWLCLVFVAGFGSSRDGTSNFAATRVVVAHAAGKLLLPKACLHRSLGQHPRNPCPHLCAFGRRPYSPAPPRATAGLPSSVSSNPHLAAS